MDEVGLSIAVVGVFLVVLIILFASTVKRVNVVAKKNFVDKLQQYDFLVDEKEKKIDELNQNIESKEEVCRELEKKIKEISENREKAKTVNLNTLPQYADLKEDVALMKYKDIKNKFDLDIRKILKIFLKNHPEEKEEKNRYQKYFRIRMYFGFKTMYRIATFQEEEQKIIIKELLKKDEWGMVEQMMMNEKKFDVIRMIDKIDNMIIQNDPKIYVYVATKNENFDEMDERIRTEFDEKIVEGFKIIYHGISYDYSI